MTTLLFIFVAAAAVLWLSIFGYLLGLVCLAWQRRSPLPVPSDWPEIAVVIPTLNEEHLVQAKLRNLRQIDYPRDRMTIVVVDGGSRDRTSRVVEEEIGKGGPIRLVRLEGTQGKAEQLNRVLGLLPQEFVVVTDADSLLDPGCIKALVGVLLHDRVTAVVGAVVHPGTPLLEERIHWWLLNHLWWLEGEALSTAIVPAPCYLLRKSAVLPLTCDAIADDVHFALTTSAHGFRVRLCRDARAEEVRVPHTAIDFLRYRRRRGAAYLRELLRPASEGRPPLPWRVARLVRLWHLLVSPTLAAGVALLACILLWTPHWHWPVLTSALFLVPAYAALGASRSLRTHSRHWWRLGLAGIRFLLLTWSAMLAMSFRPLARTAYGE